MADALDHLQEAVRRREDQPTQRADPRQSQRDCVEI
jgi:hypothetical protein